MKNMLMTNVEQIMQRYLNNEQMELLHKTLEHELFNATVVFHDGDEENVSTETLLTDFLSAKRVEGCSEKSLHYYESSIKNMHDAIGKEPKQITTEDLRTYLSNYQEKNMISKVTIDNIRRILSSFFAWLEDEDLILKSPVRRIHKVKTGITIKETYSDESLEIMRDGCENMRDLAIIDLLSSTGMRVGELVNLNIEDMDFENRECVVLGKGNKERIVYFDARAKIHIQNYLKTRTDSNNALFVTLLSPFNRLQISGVEIRLRG